MKGMGKLWGDFPFAILNGIGNSNPSRHALNVASGFRNRVTQPVIIIEVYISTIVDKPLRITVDTKGLLEACPYR